MATAWTISAKSSANISKEWEDVPIQWADYTEKFQNNAWTIILTTRVQAATES